MGDGLFDRLETWMRRRFERAGAVLDFAFRRGGLPQVDFATLLPRVEREIERNLREERGRLAAPHLIELRYDYETWTALDPQRREHLARELAASVLEYVCNRRYQIASRPEVKISYDAFTRGVEIRVGFDVPVKPVGRREARVRLVEQSTGATHTVLLVSGGEPAGIGRNIANSIVIDEPTISNFHAALLLRDNGVVELADRGGANGAAINGARLASASRAPVTDGDLISIGRVDCRLLIQDQA